MKTMKPAATQRDTDLGFDGAGAKATGKVSGNYHRNHWSGHLNDGRDVNMGRGPTKGNTGTNDTGTTAGVRSRPANMDAINAGAQVRNPGGTRPWDPKAQHNYQGNADRINVGRGPTKGNQQ